MPAIILFYLANSIFYLEAQSITSDEGTFLNYAIRYLKGHPERVSPIVDNSKMPISALNLVPRVIQQIMHPGLQKTDDGFSDIMMGRYVTLIFSVCTILLVFLWASELYGQKSGLFAAFLMSLCPNNLANASLLTTDSYSVLILLLTMYLLWKLCAKPSFKLFLLFSISTGLTQIIKQSLFHLYIILPVVLLIFYLVNRPKLLFKQVSGYLFTFIFINWFIISAGYFFNGSNAVLGSYHFKSSLFQSVQHSLPSKLIMPLPRPFVEGLDMAKYYDQVGGGIKGVSSFGKVTILGKESTGGSFWYYYFVSFLFKTPVAYFLLAFFAVILFLKKNIKPGVNNELFLWFPVLYYLITFSFFYHTQCGIRHIIFIYPFLFILISTVVNHLQSTASRIFVTGAGFYLLGSVLFYWGNYYPYTNELIPDKKVAYKYVGAGNLEFLQGKYFAEKYMTANPNVMYAPKVPATGVFLIDTENYLDIWNLHEYDWIRKYPATDHVAFSWLLIKVDNLK